MGLNLAKKKIFSRVVDAACEPVIAIVGMVVFKDALKQRRSSAVMKSSWRRLTVRFEDLRQNSLHADDGLLIDSSQKTPEAEIKDIIMAEVRRGGGWPARCSPCYRESNICGTTQVESGSAGRRDCVRGTQALQKGSKIRGLVQVAGTKDAPFRRPVVWFWHKRDPGLALRREAGPHGCGKLLPCSCAMADYCYMV